MKPDGAKLYKECGQQEKYSGYVMQHLKDKEEVNAGGLSWKGRGSRCAARRMPRQPAADLLQFFAATAAIYPPIVVLLFKSDRDIILTMEKYFKYELGYEGQKRKILLKGRKEA